VDVDAAVGGNVKDLDWKYLTVCSYYDEVGCGRGDLGVDRRVTEAGGLQNGNAVRQGNLLDWWLGETTSTTHLTIRLADDRYQIVRASE
jgi:hypothetical protein